MAAYHQMGHDSWNLLDEDSLQGYAGIVLSPVNDSPANVLARLGKLTTKRESLEVVLDPHFYRPTSERGELATWGHLVDDLDTADLSDTKWWTARCQALVGVASKIGANAVCSPAIVPRLFDDDYYSASVACADVLVERASPADLSTLMTAIVHLSELAQSGRPERIASILTSTARVSRIYLVMHDDLNPRVQRTDFAALGGAGNLIRLLKSAGTEVLVAFTGLDVLLWKAAGAQDVATGKYFNLRRFVPGRWEEDGQEGGRVLPYWTDNLLVTWLREDDLRLLDRSGLLDRDAAASNPYSQEILKIMESGEQKAWVGLGWRQYLFWFKQIEATVGSDKTQAARILLAADAQWGRINDASIYLFDRKNTGDWIRPWLNAIRLAAA